ncbi:hypothetical protein LA324_02690 [Corynebacterium coyleae]|uniref:hypothetical protein n=1 Tax=Corynebacterium coyleae TaxID=53374 RepID=UPI001CCFBCE9|nr:hypothetical protein [Corynebacterium coyleae]UBI09565.1 hypothetical protein LA324_02690 [Corynebacterium coyleae]
MPVDFKVIQKALKDFKTFATAIEKIFTKTPESLLTFAEKVSGEKVNPKKPAADAK